MCAQYALSLLLSLPLRVKMTNCTRCVRLYAFVCGGNAACSVDQRDFFFPLKKSEKELEEPENSLILLPAIFTSLYL